MTPTPSELPHLRYFGLDRPPFSIAPDPRFLYLGEHHQEALAHLVWGLNTDGGFVVLTGEVGTGKTTLSRSLLDRVPENTDIAYVINPRLSAWELLATLCEELGDAPIGEQVSSKRLVDRINRLLLAAHALDRRTVLVIDEAQNLTRDVLEQIRLLTNLETSERKLLQVVLIGQPELDDMLRRPDLRQLAQRVTARYHLKPMSREELSRCMRHRLEVAGAQRNPFTRRGLAELYRCSRGIPRVANLIADRALLGAYASDQDRIGAGIVRRAAREVVIRPATSTRLPVASAAALLLVVGAGASIWFTLQEESVAGLFDRGPSAVAVSPGPMAAEQEAQPAVAATEPTRDDTRAVESATPVQTAPPPPPDTTPARESSAAAVPMVALLQDAQADAAVTAFQGVVDRWFVPLDVTDADALCGQAGRVGLNCLEFETDWEELAALDLPAVLHLTGAGRPDRVAMVAMDRQRIQLATEDGLRWHERAELDSNWTGTATVLWQLPPGYRRPLQRGNRGEPVRWLRMQLSEAGHSSSGRADEFDASLERALLDFQGRHGLEQDGIAGPMSWIQLQRLTGTGIPTLAVTEDR